jgi:hypothetical protein
MVEGHFFIFFLKYFALILIYFIIGHGILRLFRIKVPISSFVQYFAWSAGLGFIFSSVIIALIFSYGKTIALAAILPLAWFIYSLKKDENTSNQQNLKLDFDLKEIILALLLLVILYIIIIINKNLFYGADNIFRANVSNLMIFSNQETTNSYNLLKGYNYNYSPYHYMYLWNNGLVSMLFTKGNALSAYIYITNPALLFIVILLFYSILKIFVKNTYISFFLSLVVLFFPFICFNNIISISASIFHIDANKINAIYDKFGTIINYPILFLFFDLKTINFLLLLLIGVYTYSFNKKASIGIFGVAPVFSPLLLTLPASYFTIQLFSKKERKVHLLLIPLFIIIYFILIKFILSSQNNINAFNEFILYPYICNLKAKTLINYFLVVILSTFIFGFIYWLAFFIYYKFIPSEKRNSILNWAFKLFMGIIIFSIIATFINYGNINSVQYIVYNSFFISYIGFIFLIFVIIHFINQIKNIKKQKLIKIIIFIIFSFFLIQGLFILIKDSKNSNNNSQNEYKSNNIILSKTNNESDMIKIGVININTYINSINNNLIYFLYIPTLYIKESYFYDNKNSYKVVSVLLDTLPQNIKLSDDSCLNLYYINELKKFLPFDIYWDKNYADSPIPIDSAKMNFIREQKMNYILLYNGAIYKDSLPSYLRPYVDTFYILEPNKDTLFKIAG